MSMKQPDKKWVLRLYVAGLTPVAERALSNIRTICMQYLEGQYSLEVIDLLESPALAEGDQIFAVPTLVRQLPTPLRKIVGDLSNTPKVVLGLDIKAAT
jgi:circadian clock protein KaiB